MTAVRAIGDSVLRLDGVSLAFGGVKALNDISLDVREHEIRAIIGPNGAGRARCSTSSTASTTRSRGRSPFRGKPRHDMDTHETAALGIARTFQNIALFRGMSVLDNIMTGRNLKMKATSWSRRSGSGAPGARSSRIGARSRRSSISWRFSTYERLRSAGCRMGCRKRVELARALAAEPSLLLLDEPMAGMNVEEKQDMCRFVLDVNEQYGTTVVLIEHDMGVVMDISDRVVVLDYGRKIGDGTPDEVRNSKTVIDAYLGVPH
jgi:branched-chain amino acid transport system ATP-binding protein